MSEIVIRLPSVLTEVAEQLAADHPGYARFVDSEFANVLAGAFLERLFCVAAQGHHARPGFVTEAERALFVTIGRAHHQQHQDVDALLAAYRIGASVVWRHVADVALLHRLPSAQFAGLASAVFAAVEELSAAGREGYLDARSEQQPSIRRHRHELLGLLLAEAPGAWALRAVAARADWPVPERDEQLLDALRARLLGPVLDLPDPSAGRLLETLGSWLLHMGNGRAVADDLHVHPQTVRYRLGRLRELLDLDIPSRRAAMLLALGWPATEEPAAPGDGGDRS
ncbi:helix-turn-helix domain-containing protein [Pseudonocardia halophobica]|uniref:helix-turn-helix domain-containing protein n=1 Tax=Pseudonocardia halophobica TaxID=29401 RepID=UPI0012DEB0B5|nr:helix-turn-helix domain-containing protein [Pseudonocardia halophobica]